MYRVKKTRTHGKNAKIGDPSYITLFFLKNGPFLPININYSNYNYRLKCNGYDSVI